MCKAATMWAPHRRRCWGPHICIIAAEPWPFCWFVFKNLLLFLSAAEDSEKCLVSVCFYYYLPLCSHMDSLFRTFQYVQSQSVIRLAQGLDPEFILNANVSLGKAPNLKLLVDCVASKWTDVLNVNVFCLVRCTTEMQYYVLLLQYTV